MGIDGSHYCHDTPVAYQALHFVGCFARQANIHADDLDPLLAQSGHMLFDQFRDLGRAAETGQTNGEDHTWQQPCLRSTGRIVGLVSIARDRLLELASLLFIDEIRISAFVVGAWMSQAGRELVKRQVWGALRSACCLDYQRG